MNDALVKEGFDGVDHAIGRVLEKIGALEASLGAIETKLTSIDESVRACVARLPPPGALEAVANAVRITFEPEQRAVVAEVARLRRQVEELERRLRGY